MPPASCSVTKVGSRGAQAHNTTHISTSFLLLRSPLGCAMLG